jgi:hypothetical protein
MLPVAPITSTRWMAELVMECISLQNMASASLPSNTQEKQDADKRARHGAARSSQQCIHSALKE